jgi:hypothetical protein
MTLGVEPILFRARRNCENLDICNKSFRWSFFFKKAKYRKKGPIKEIGRLRSMRQIQRAKHIFIC